MNKNFDSFNPFTNRAMIKKENEFVGRIRELDDIISRLRGGNSVSVVGERRIGKSSLLYHLFLTGNRRLGDPRKKEFKFVYLEMHDIKTKTPEGFLGSVIKELGLECKVDDLKTNPLIVFTELLEKNNESGMKPILLIDEFDKIVELHDLFNDDFMETLRHICNNGLLTLVTSSRATLRDLTDQGKITSPFWNIFSIVNLGEFVVDEHINEPALFLTHFWKDKLEPTDKEKTWLTFFPSKHPMKLQIISFWILQNRKLEFDDYTLSLEIEKEIKSFFRSDIEKIGNYLKKALPKAPQQIIWTTEFVGKLITNLAPIKGIWN